MPVMTNFDEAGLRPLEKGEFVDNDDDSRSTERKMVYEMDGEHIVIPSLWMSANGPLDLRMPSEGGLGMDRFAPLRAALQYEKRTGRKFPRFKTAKEAEEFEHTRRGGTDAGPLAR